MKRQCQLKCVDILNIEELTFSFGVNGVLNSHNPHGCRHANAKSPGDIFSLSCSASRDSSSPPLLGHTTFCPPFRRWVFFQLDETESNLWSPHIHPSSSSHFGSLCTKVFWSMCKELEGQTGFMICSSAGHMRATSTSSSSSACEELNKEQVKLMRVNHRDTERRREASQSTCRDRQEVETNSNCIEFATSWIYPSCHLMYQGDQMSFSLGGGVCGKSPIFSPFLIFLFVSPYHLSSASHLPLLSILSFMFSVLFFFLPVSRSKVSLSHLFSSDICCCKERQFDFLFFHEPLKISLSLFLLLHLPRSWPQHCISTSFLSSFPPLHFTQLHFLNSLQSIPFTFSLSTSSSFVFCSR